MLIDKLLLKLVKTEIIDPSHDGNHVQRVLNMAVKITQKENADMEVIIPAAIFHDAVIYQKNDERNKIATEKSSEFAKKVLEEITDFPKHKISHVMDCILECSYSKGMKPSSLESAILQDADRLEATGAISIMRTFSSGGQMGLPFYNPEDPFRENSDPSNTEFGLDLLYKRLYLVSEGMNTETAKRIAIRRHKFLKTFEKELRIELEEMGVYLDVSKKR
ncbi:MAG TPA: HD domain-containing protein [Candidatus Paceibacterota bacterium]